MKFQFVTAVWGEWHTNAFLNLNLPTLLASNNLPKICLKNEGRYKIYTRRSDAQKISQSPIFEAMSKIIPTDLVVWNDTFFDQDPMQAHNIIWRQGINEAREAGEWIALISPDTIWSNGSFEYLASLFEQGKTLIYGFVLRVMEETFLTDLQKNFPHSASSPLSISSRDLVDISFKHIAPLYSCYLRTGEHVPFHAEYILYPVYKEGILLRVVTGHCFALNPSKYELTEHLSPISIDNPGDVAFITDSDDFLGLSLTPSGYQINWFLPSATFERSRPARISHNYFSPVALNVSRQKFIYHTGDVSTPAWRRAIHQSDYFMIQDYFKLQVHSLNQIIGIDGSDDHPLRMINSFASRPNRKWAVRGPVTYFIPTDKALKKLPRAILRDLLAFGNDKDLREVLFDHMIKGDISCPGVENEQDLDSTTTHANQTVTTLSGKELQLEKKGGKWLINGATVLRRVATDSPHNDRFRIYRIDNVLSL